ncbi:MAG: accessory gene regulator ArgB-like protein [Bacilli bacterium]
MLDKTIENIADIIMEKETNPNIDKDIIMFGIKTGVEIIANVLTTIILGLIFGLVLESIIFLISFSFIRMYAGGYHCEKAINCYIMSSLTIFVVLVLIEVTPVKFINIVSFAILTISVIILYKFAPVETTSKPIDMEERVYYRKKVITNLIIEIVLISILFLMNLNIYAFVISLCIFVSSISILLELYLIKERRRYGND